MAVCTLCGSDNTGSRCTVCGADVVAPAALPPTSAVRPAGLDPSISQAPGPAARTENTPTSVQFNGPPERPAPTTTTASAKTTTTTAPKAAPATTSTKPAVSLPKGKVALAAVLVAIGIGYVMSQQGSANDPAVGPTSAASTSEAAGASAPQTDPPAVPPPNPANENQTIRSLPRGTWLTVLESLPQTDYTEPQAWDKAREAPSPGSPSRSSTPAPSPG